MRYLVAAQVFTVVALGASIFNGSLIHSVAIGSSMDGTPLYLVHPLFTLEFFLMLSVAVVWLIVLMFSLHSRQREKLIDIIRQDWLGFLLVVFTVIAAVSGCIGFSEKIHFDEFRADDLLGLPGLPPPDVFTFLRAINGIGFLVCEPVWILKMLWEGLKHYRSRDKQT